MEPLSFACNLSNVYITIGILLYCDYYLDSTTNTWLYFISYYPLSIPLFIVTSFFGSVDAFQNKQQISLASTLNIYHVSY